MFKFVVFVFTLATSALAHADQPTTGHLKEVVRTIYDCSGSVSLRSFRGNLVPIKVDVYEMTDGSLLARTAVGADTPLQYNPIDADEIKTEGREIKRVGSDGLVLFSLVVKDPKAQRSDATIQYPSFPTNQPNRGNLECFLQPNIR